MIPLNFTWLTTSILASFLYFYLLTPDFNHNNIRDKIVLHSSSYFRNSHIISTCWTNSDTETKLAFKSGWPKLFQLCDESTKRKRICHLSTVRLWASTALKLDEFSTWYILMWKYGPSAHRLLGTHLCLLEPIDDEYQGTKVLTTLNPLSFRGQMRAGGFSLKIISI